MDFVPDYVVRGSVDHSNPRYVVRQPVLAPGLPPTRSLPAPPKSFADFSGQHRVVRYGRQVGTEFDYVPAPSLVKNDAQGTTNYRWGTTSRAAMAYMSHPPNVANLNSENIQRLRSWGERQTIYVDSAGEKEAEMQEMIKAVNDGERQKLRLVGRNGVNYISVNPYMRQPRSRYIWNVPQKVKHLDHPTRMRLSNTAVQDSAYHRAYAEFLENFAEVAENPNISGERLEWLRTDAPRSPPHKVSDFFRSKGFYY